MTAVTKIEGQKIDKVAPKKTGLDLLREPFPANQISKLPKPTKQQTEEVRNNFKAGVRCQECGQWHHPKVQHLDYVGHAALTDRLLDCDPNWNWEPVAFDDRGRPMLDENGGMWIRLTVCGQTRLGYGHPDGKKGGDAIKEVIGDALRNAAMRFGAALDLWHKGELHVTEQPQQDAEREPQGPDHRATADRIITAIRKRKGDRDALSELWADEKHVMANMPPAIFDEVKAEFGNATPPKPAADIDPEAIPY